MVVVLALAEMEWEVETRVCGAIAAAEFVVFARGSGVGEVFLVGAAVVGGGGGKEGWRPIVWLVGIVGEHEIL